MNLIQKKCSVPFTAVEVRQDMEMMRQTGVDCGPREVALVSCSASPVTLPTVSLWENAGPVLCRECQRCLCIEECQRQDFQWGIWKGVCQGLTKGKRAGERHGLAWSHAQISWSLPSPSCVLYRYLSLLSPVMHPSLCRRHWHLKSWSR